MDVRQALAGSDRAWACSSRANTRRRERSARLSNACWPATIFDFVGWEVRTFAAKAEQMIVPAPGLYRRSAPQVACVGLHRIGASAFSKSQDEIDEHLFRSQDRRSVLRVGQPAPEAGSTCARRQAAQQTLVETILEEQVSTILSEEGFAIGGQVVPPLKFRLSRLCRRC